MSIQQQRFLLITFFLVAFAGHEIYLWNNPTLSCEVLRDDPIYDLNFNAYTDTTAHTRFMLWLDTHYEIRSVKDGSAIYEMRPANSGSAIAWEKGRIEYKAHFEEGGLASIEVITYPLKTDVQDIMGCFGPPSESVAMAVRNGNEGMINLNYIWYDDLRIFMLGTAPTGAIEGTLAPLDETAEVRSFFIYSPSVYEREKR